MGLSLLEVQNALGALGQLDRAAPVILGDMVLSGSEVPDELVIGGNQTLVIHRLLGGGRVIDSVGNDPARLILTGRFLGPLATRRARRIEAMRDQAQVLGFSVADLSARVWIAAFSWSYQARGSVCPYRLVLEREMLPPARSEGLSERVALDMRDGLSSLTDILGDMTDAGWTGTNALSALAGQMMPVAQSLGAGGAVSRAQAALSHASSLWQTGMSVSRLPQVLGAVEPSLSLAHSDLTQLGDEAGRGLDEGALKDTGDLVTLGQNAGASVMSVEGSSYITRARNLLRAS